MFVAARQPLVLDFVRPEPNHGPYLRAARQASTAALERHPPDEKAAVVNHRFGKCLP